MPGEDLFTRQCPSLDGAPRTQVCESNVPITGKGPDSSVRNEGMWEGPRGQAGNFSRPGPVVCWGWADRKELAPGTTCLLTWGSIQLRGGTGAPGLRVSVVAHRAELGSVASLEASGALSPEARVLKTFQPLVRSGTKIGVGAESQGGER